MRGGDSSEGRVRTGTAEEHDRRPAVLCADRAQGLELLVISGMRRGGEEHERSRPAGQCVHCGEAIAARCGRVRFVDDQQIPADVLEWMESFGALDEVQRRQVHARKGPRVHVRRQLTGRAAKPGRVSVDRLHAEECCQLLVPLAPDRRGRKDQCPRQVTLHRQLANDQSRFDRLSQSDVVCNQQAGDTMSKHCESGLELIGQQVDGFGTELQTTVRLGPPKERAHFARPTLAGYDLETGS